MRKWFDEKGLWSGWNAEPHPTINWRIFSEYYFREPYLWENAFAFLKNTDLGAIEPGVYDVDPGKLVIMVQEYTTREIGDTQYEAHQRFADIQYVVEGAERIGIARLTGMPVVQPYDSKRDIVFLHGPDEQIYRASQDSFFVFFPDDAHRPCIKDQACARVKKIVAKVRL